jgi:hypothetical protein
MKKLLVGLAALPFLASVAIAGQPVSLNDTQMDKVVAGLNVWYSFSTGLVVPSTCTACVNFNAPNFDGLAGFPSSTAH